jgi:DNA-binding winged helix-turn-helix (wHTH) protein/Tol biopolymer transport system component
MQTTENTKICFGEFELDLLHRLLLKSGRPVALKTKAFDLLATLIDHRGEVVSKNDLLDRVWENQFVEENNLTVHVAALRKALGETKNENRFIVTVPGSGYKFVAELDKPKTVEIVVESHKVERFAFEEEIEVETDESGFKRRDEIATHDQNGTAAAVPLARTSVGWINRYRIAAGLIIAVGLVGIGGYFLGPRLSARFASAPPFVRHSVRQLTTNGKVGSAALSPDGKLFAYTIDDLGQKSLWLGYVDGGNHLLLRPAAEASYRTIAFSPDGKDIYFSLRDDKNPKFALYRMPAFGGVQTKLLDEIGSFALSPDGRSIAIARRDKDLEKDLVVIAPLDGTQPRDVASFPKELSVRFDTISWSADGKRLALSAKTDSENEIAVVEIATGEITRITHESLREITKTAWLRDGSGLIMTAIKPASDSSVPQYMVYMVAYPSGELHPITSDRSNYGASWHNDAGVSISLSAASDLLLAVEHRQLSNVWVAPSDDLSAARQITFSSFGKYDGLWGMDWTPDGRLIYTTSDTQSQFLSQMNSDGSDQRPITAPAGFDSVLTVEQSGRYVVFHSDRNSTIDIWRTDIDGANPMQLTFGGKAFHPAPSPDGQWVYYKSNLKGNGHLCRVPIDGGEPEILNDKETSWISFSPDGKYFAASYITDKQRLAIFSADTNRILKQFDLPKTGTLYMGSRWTPDSKAVTFRDNNYGYWIQPIDGGDATRLEGLPKEKFYNMSWSKDGKWFAFIRGQEIRDVVLIQNN